MRILVLATDAFGGFGGIAKYNRDLLTALCSHPGVDEVVAIPRTLPGKVGTLPAKLAYLTDGASGKLDFVRTAWNAIRTAKPFDLILCGHVNLVPLAYALRKVSGARVGLIMHGIEAWQPTPSMMTNRMIRDLDVYICVSRVTRTRFCAWSGVQSARVFLLPNCVDVEKFGPGPRSEPLMEKYGLVGKRAIMTLGRLDAAERYKGFDEVLESMPKLLKEVPELMYVIAGDGSDKARLQEKVKQLGLQKHVVFTGRITEEIKAHIYRAMDAFVMPGRGEGFGIVYLEAMACGIPVVASTLDGSREAVREGELGILVNPDNQEEIVEGILLALNKPRGMVPAGLDYFSWENYQRRCHALLEQMVPSTEAEPIRKAA